MFTVDQKLKALSICHIFETSTPLGNSTTVAVLKDGAGISYGIPQATHKSGNLLDVIERYVAGSDEPLYEPLFRKWIPTLRKTDQRTVNTTAKNEELKRALKEAGAEPEMRKAQLGNIADRMDKAIRACAGSGFTSTMALAVIYDSINHGSWDRIRDKIPSGPEKQWIKSYLTVRKAWLTSHNNPLLRKTVYRVNFFLEEISKANWNLDLPLNVHGFKLKGLHIAQAEQELKELNKSGVNTAAHESEPQEIETPPETEPVAVEIENDGYDAPETPAAPDVKNEEKEKVAIEKPASVGFFKGLWTRVSALLGGNVTFEVVADKAQQAQTLGLSENTWKMIGFFVLCASLIYILGYIYSRVVEIIRNRDITKMLVEANTTPNNFVQLVDSDLLDLYRSKGYKVITR